MIYDGPVYFWTVNQAAIAAAKYPGYAPTQYGVDLLQFQWRDSGELPLSNTTAPVRNMTWALAAFEDIKRRSVRLKYEEVPV